MKKTIRINISRLIFNIDEDAYHKLQQYLSSITKKFLNTEEGNEIIADVEARIAELFQERIGDRKEVVNLSDVEYVVEIMGMPEDFEDEAEDETDYAETHSKKTGRRIYRDSENRIISGLSAGIAAYFGTEPVVIRVIFVLMTLFYGSSVLIYILLWIIIPEAKTRSQKLEMRGQDINLSNIETSIKKEFNTVKSNFNKWQKSGSYDRLKTNLGDILNMFSKVMLIFAKFILILMGISFIIVGMAFLGSMTGLFFFNDTMLSPFSWNNVPFSIYEFATLFTDEFNARVGITSSYLVVIIPVLVIIYLGLKFIFRFKTKTRYLGVFAGALWLVSLIVLIGAGVKFGYGMRADEEVLQNYKIEHIGSDTLYLKLFANEDDNHWSSNRERFNNVYIEFNEGAIDLSGQPGLNIRKNETNETELTVIKKSNGANGKEALQLARKIKYDWQQDDSIIYFQRYFFIGENKKVRDQSLNIILKLPVGKIVYLGNNMDAITNYIDNIQDFSDHEMTGEYWIMTQNGLSLLEKHKRDISEDKKFNEQINTSKDETNIKEEIEAMKLELDSM